MTDSQHPTIERVTLTNENMRVSIANYGARILSIKYKNSAGMWIETTLNYTLDHDILSDNCYMGATCGRVSNRISGAKYVHKGEVVKLCANDGNNTLHGGKGGFSHCFWSMSPIVRDGTSEQITLLYRSVHGDQGFVGNLHAQVKYILTHDNHLRIEYKASCDRHGPINMCNHTYFTLGEASIHPLKLTVFAKKYLPLTANSIPTGEISLLNSEHSFEHGVVLADRLLQKDIDDCYLLLKKPTTQNCQLAGELRSQTNNIMLSISTNQIAMQVYTGNYLPIKHSAIALEAQGLVDAVNQAGFESDWVGPHQEYDKVVDYHFQSLSDS